MLDQKTENRYHRHKTIITSLIYLALQNILMFWIPNSTHHEIDGRIIVGMITGSMFTLFYPVVVLVTSRLYWNAYKEGREGKVWNIHLKTIILICLMCVCFIIGK